MERFVSLLLIPILAFNGLFFGYNGDPPLPVDYNEIKVVVDSDGRKALLLNGHLYYDDVASLPEDTETDIVTDSDTGCDTGADVASDTETGSTPTSTDGDTSNAKDSDTDHWEPIHKPPVEGYYYYGDVNFNNRVDMTDVVWIQRNIAQMQKFSAIMKCAADVDADGFVGVKDVIYIQKFIAQLNNRFPAGRAFHVNKR